MRDASRDPGGQHRAAGNVLIGLGVTGVVVAVVGWILKLDLPFLDPSTMAAASAGMTLIGWWQRSSGADMERAAGPDASSPSGSPGNRDQPSPSRPARMG